MGTDKQDRIRQFIRGEILSARERNNEFLRSSGCPSDMMRTGILEYESLAIEEFLATHGTDDDAAVEAASKLFFALSDGSRGSATVYLLIFGGMSPRPFAALLKHAWGRGKTGSILGIAMPQSLVIDAFRKARQQAPDVLMGDGWPHYQNLPQIITVYRGVRHHKATRGMAWSMDELVARGFASRGWGGDSGRLLAAEISKAHVLALLEPPGEGESEAVCNPRALRNVRVIEDDIPLPWEDAA
jgi:hypothetical protein